MAFLLLWIVLLSAQEPAAAPDSTLERRTGLSLRTLLPLATAGSISHHDDALPATNVQASPENADPFVNPSLSFDLGPFQGPHHLMLTLELNRVGFEVLQQSGISTRGDMGEWLDVEAIAGVDWRDEKRSRMGAGFALGYHRVTYGVSVGGINDIDESIAMVSVGLQLYGELALGSGFRLGSEARAALLMSGGGSWSDTKGTGNALSIAAWLAWEPVHRFVLRAGYGAWKGHAQWDSTPWLSNTTASNTVDVRCQGPVLSLEIGF